MLIRRNQICISFAFFVSLFLQSQNQTIFKHLTLNYNGRDIISANSIQDNQGKIWFSYDQGILQYDGYDLTFISSKTIFKSTNTQSLKSIIKDSVGNILLLSKSGNISMYTTNARFVPIDIDFNVHIDKIYHARNNIFFSSKNGDIFHFSDFKTKKITSIPNSNSSFRIIKSLSLSKSNNLYIGTTKGDIFIYSLINDKWGKLNGSFSNFPGDIILTLDLKDNLWIGTETLGLYVYDIINEKFFQDDLFKNSKYNLSKELFISIYCDSKGSIWAGTDGSGLYHINPNSKKITSYRANSNNKYALSSNTIININEDQNNNLWVITNYGDVNILPSNNDKIHYYSGSDDYTPQRILSIYIAKNGDTWLGTDGNGLTRIRIKPDGSEEKIQFLKNKEGQKGFYIQSITEDLYGNIWLGTYKNGLWVFNIKDERFKKIPIINTKNQIANDVRTVFKDSKDRIWVGSSITTNVYSSNQELLASFENSEHGLKGYITEKIVEDINKNIWLGYYPGGLFKFNEDRSNFKNSKFKRHPFFNNNEESIFTDKIRDMTVENEFILLVNANGRLFKFNTNTHEYLSFENIEAFKNINFTSVQTDKQNNIWLSSTNGITSFNPKDTLVTRFYETDGLQGNFFLDGSSFKDNQDILYFGGMHGVNYFNPAEIKKKESKANLYISNIEILNQPADSLIADQLVNGVINVKRIQLKYNQSSFSFKFSVIDNILNPNYHYSYKLEGFDKEWINSHQNRIATYTNIPSGNYTFVVKAGNKINELNIPSKSIIITIENPWWKHTMAYFTYLIFLASLTFFTIRWINLRKKLITEELNHKKENELHDLKMDFFTKMSHEIQTPLTLILGPIEDMLVRSKQNGNLLLNQRLKIISNNVKRLSKIVFELTTVRNKELNRLKLLVKKNNLYDEIHEISLSFKEEARIKKIDFTTNCPKNLTETWYDKDKMEHIIYNLLSNAFKFTPRNGNIQLNIIPIKSKDSIKISIADSGSGIPPEELEDIFTLFYQSKMGKKLKGSGIGLSLTKELINLHRGKIEVTTSYAEGTCFTITIPISEKNYSESEKIMTDSFTEEIEDINFDQQNLENKNTNDRSKKTILIVEDNFELQLFLQDLLKNNYNIILAENGKEGLHYAKTKMPDLILSDLMMPIMDGIEMCNLLQKDVQTKHIPIVLITAKNSSNSKIEGLKSGAIEYINKPFNTTELQLKLRNILSSKDNIISKFKKEVISSPNIHIQKTQDYVFLENLVLEINLRIENANFKMEELAQSLNMSYSTLYRKCLTLTGNSLVDFVRLLRLKKAAIIITKYGYTISETAFMTGFNDPKYFSKCFKKQFGITPKNFRKESVKLGIETFLKMYRLDDV